MAYYLTVKEKNNYKLLDISYLKEFKRISRFKNSSYSLDEIDNFTSLFDSELSLKRKLYNTGVITTEDISKKIEIRMKTNGKLEKVKHGLVYSYMRKYLDTEYLRMKILELQNDTNFLKKLITYYRSSRNQESLSEIRAILLGYKGCDLNIYNSLSKFYTKEIYDIDYKTGEIKIKYKSLHDLAMFIYNYIDKINKSNIEIEANKLTNINELANLKELLPLQEKPEIHVKKRVRKKREELEGQTSLFD